MGRFSYISHTADKGFRVQAKSLQDLFETAVKGMASLFREDLAPGKTELPETQTVEATAEDITGLLVDFLSEVLTLSHIHKTVFLRADIVELSATHISATIYGTGVDHFDEDIKAVTYHQADIRETQDGGFETVVVFDI